jgi:hypothetical protein
MKMGEEAIELFYVCQVATLPVFRLHSVDYTMTNEFGAVGGMKIGRRNRSTRRKPALG